MSSLFALCLKAINIFPANGECIAADANRQLVVIHPGNQSAVGSDGRFQRGDFHSIANFHAVTTGGFRLDRRSGVLERFRLMRLIIGLGRNGRFPAEVLSERPAKAADDHRQTNQTPNQIPVNPPVPAIIKTYVSSNCEWIICHK